MTKTPNVKHERNPFIGMFRNRGGKIETGSLAFDSSYPVGGEEMEFSFTPNTVTIEPQGQYSFEYDHTNSKVKVFQQAPPIVYEEVVSVSATTDIGYLKYPAAHIEYVSDETDNFFVIPGGLTPTAKMVAVDMGFSLTTGVLTKGKRTALHFLPADNVTSCKVSYITQAWKEVADNMVQACITSGVATYGHADLAFAAGTPDALTMGEDLIAVQCVCWNDAATLKNMTALKDGGTLGTGATECIIDFTDGIVSFHQTDAVDTTGDLVYITYIRDPGAGYFIHDRFDYTEIADA